MAVLAISLCCSWSNIASANGDDSFQPATTVKYKGVHLDLPLAPVPSPYIPDKPCPAGYGPSIYGCREHGLSAAISIICRALDVDGTMIMSRSRPTKSTVGKCPLGYVCEIWPASEDHRTAVVARNGQVDCVPSISLAQAVLRATTGGRHSRRRPRPSIPGRCGVVQSRRQRRRTTSQQLAEAPGSITVVAVDVPPSPQIEELESEEDTLPQQPSPVESTSRAEVHIRPSAAATTPPTNSWEELGFGDVDIVGIFDTRDDEAELFASLFDDDESNNRRPSSDGASSSYSNNCWVSWEPGKIP